MTLNNYNCSGTSLSLHYFQLMVVKTTPGKDFHGDPFRTDLPGYNFISTVNGISLLPQSS